MTEEKMILNDGQYDLDMRTREVSVSADVLADKGWHKLDSNEQIVKRVVLTPEEAEWFDENRTLPSLDHNINLEFFSRLAEQATKYPEIDRWAFVKRIMRAYVLGNYVVKERKYYIKLGFGFSKYLNVKEDGDWWFTNEMPMIPGQSQFTQAEINEMQKDPRAKGLDLNVLKVEVPEDELEE